MQLQASGDVIPFLLMADVGRHLEGLHAAAEYEGAPPSEELVRLCAFLSGAHATGNAEVKQLVEAAFVQDFDAPSAGYASFRGLIGPGLRSAVESSWPGVDFG